MLARTGFAQHPRHRHADGDAAGTINEADARRLYPQGHGDAWGHYLTAIKNYYRLLRSPSFTWVPRIEAVIVEVPDPNHPYGVRGVGEVPIVPPPAALAKIGRAHV